MSAVLRVEETLRVVHDHIAALRTVQHDDPTATASNPLRWAGVQHLVQIAIQACVDIGDEVLAFEGINEPPRSRDVFPTLAEAGILRREPAQALFGLVDVRNELAHQYRHVTAERLFPRLPMIIQTCEQFAEDIARWLAGP